MQFLPCQFWYLLTSVAFKGEHKAKGFQRKSARSLLYMDDFSFIDLSRHNMLYTVKMKISKGAFFLWTLPGGTTHGGTPDCFAQGSPLLCLLVSYRVLGVELVYSVQGKCPFCLDHFSCSFLCFFFKQVFWGFSFSQDFHFLHERW